MGHHSVAQNTVLKSEMVTVGTKKKHLMLDAGLNIFFKSRFNKITQMHTDPGNEM